MCSLLSYLCDRLLQTNRLDLLANKTGKHAILMPVFNLSTVAAASNSSRHLGSPSGNPGPLAACADGTATGSQLEDSALTDLPQSCRCAASAAPGGMPRGQMQSSAAVVWGAVAASNAACPFKDWRSLRRWHRIRSCSCHVLSLPALECCKPCSGNGRQGGGNSEDPAA